MLIVMKIGASPEEIDQVRRMARARQRDASRLRLTQRAAEGALE